MGSFSNTIARFQQLQSVSVRLRRRLLGDARSELASAITDHLLVFGNSLLHLETGASLQIDDLGEASVLASAASKLLSEGHRDSKEEKSIKLFLAPSEFVVTASHMPGLVAENLESALKLQRETLLPAFETALSLAIPSLLTDEEEVHALWMPSQRLNQLFEAFAEKGLLLAMVQPRILCVTNEASVDSIFHVLEEDGDDLTLMSWRNGVLATLLATKKCDLEEGAFSEQWQGNLDPLSNVIKISSDNLQAYLESKPSPQPGYGFFPDGAIAARKKVEKSRQYLLAASLVAGLLLLAALPFLFQSLELRMAESRLQAAQQMSADARGDQRMVVDFENEWGTIYDFPDQQLRLAMFRLQEVLGDERLSSLELNEGLIRIQGTSSDPQAILQRLEQDPMFTEVIFSRATNNTRYYIDLRLATVNFEAYMLRYFPDQS